MTISFKNQEYTSVEALLLALPEQSRQVLSVRISGDEETIFEELKSALQHSDVPYPIQVNIGQTTVELDAKNSELQRLYLEKSRAKAKIELRAAALEASQGDVASISDMSSVRKDKVDFAKGVTASLSLQQQQQQQQQQQYSQKRRVRARSKNKASDDKDDTNEVIQDASNLGILINRNNLSILFEPEDVEDRDAALAGRDSIPEEMPDAEKKRWYQCFDGLIGNEVIEEDSADSPPDRAGTFKTTSLDKRTKRIFTHVTEDAMRKAMDNPLLFQNGLVEGNLPAGFYLQKVRLSSSDAEEVIETVLCFDSAKNKTPTPLAIHVEKSATQLGWTTSESFEISRLFDENVSLEDMKSSFRRAWDVLKDEFDAPSILESLDSLALGVSHYRGLSHILLEQGAEGVCVFLDQLRKMQANGTYASFKKHFLDTSDNYMEFMDPAGIARLQRYVELSDREFEWWDSLISQHAEANTPFSFENQFGGYQYFLEQLSLLNVHQQFENTAQPYTRKTSQGHGAVKNMDVVLDRTLYLLNNARDPSEQLMNLEGLDFSMYGAEYAMRHEGLLVVTKEMQITTRGSGAAVAFNSRDKVLGTFKNIIKTALKPDGDLPAELDAFLEASVTNKVTLVRESMEERQLLTGAIYAVNQAEYLTCIGLNEIAGYLYEPPEDTLTPLFFRYVGTQDPSYDITVYQELYQHILDLPEALDGLTKRNLLVMAALWFTNDLTSTHPTEDFAELIDELKEWVLPGGSISNTVDGVLKRMAARHSFLSCSEYTEALKKCRESMGSLHGAEGNPPEQLIYQLYALAGKERGQKTMHALVERNKRDTSFHLPIQFLANINGATVQDFMNSLEGEDTEQYPKRERALSLMQVLSLIDAQVDLISRGTNLLHSIFNDSNTRAVILREFNALPPRSQHILLEVLGDINVVQSERLLFLEDFKTFCSSVGDTFNELPDLSDAELKQAMIALLNEKHPKISIGTGAVEPMKTTIVGDILPSFKSQIEEPIGYLRGDPLYTTQSKPILDGVRRVISDRLLQAADDFLTECEREPKDEEALLAAFWEVEKLINNLLDEWLVKTALGLVDRSYGLSPVEKACKDQQSIMPLINEKAQRKISDQINKMLQSLQTQIVRGLSNTLISHIGEVDSNKDTPMATRIREYEQRYNEVKGFLNALIHLKNNQPKAFRTILSIIQDKGYLHKVSVPLLTGVTQALSIQGPGVDVSFSQVMDKLIEFPQATPEQHKRVFESLNVLSQYQTQLVPEQLTELLGMSLQHHLTTHTTFPLERLLNIRSELQYLQEEEAESLTANVLKLLGMGLQAEVVEQAIQATLHRLGESQQNHRIFTYVHAILKAYVSESGDPGNIMAYQALLDGIPADDPKRSQWLIIFNSILSNETCDVLTLYKLMVVMNGLQDKELSFLSDICAFKPCPKAQKIIDLQEEAGDLTNYLREFDLNPFGVKRGDEFSTKRLESTLLGMQDLLSSATFTDAKRAKLAQQMLYVNAVGQGSTPIKLSDNTYTDLRQQSRSELRNLFDVLREQLPKLSGQEKEKRQLQLLAVMREVYWRSTKRFPHSTQMIGLLLSLDQADNNLLMQINTGEGKSVSTPLLAALQWAIDPGSVDVVTGNPDLVRQDYEGKGARKFFSALGIRSNVVKGDSPAGTYCVGGINYSDISGLSLYRARAKREGEALVKPNQKSHLVLDEVDLEMFDDRTFFLLVELPPGVTSSEENPHEWVYRLVNDFIDKPEFKVLPPEDGFWDKKEDLRQFRKYLEKNATIAQKSQIAEFSDKVLNRWINAACQAATLTEQEQFIIEKVERPGHRLVSMAVPLVSSLPQRGASYSDGVQQCLHARLKKQYPEDAFPIDAEMLTVASESSKGFIDGYQRSGRLIGLSGSMGQHEELLEIEGKYAARVFKIPPHNPSQRKLFPSEVKQDTQAQLERISLEISQIKSVKGYGKQPVLMVCSDITHAIKRAAYLKRKHASKGWLGRKPAWEVQLITGQESDEERERMYEKASKSNVITVTTPISGRGIDFDFETKEGEPLKHKDGLFGMATDLFGARTLTQIMGRCARNGYPGRFMAIYDQGELPQSHCEEFTFQHMSQQEVTYALSHIQRKMNAEEAVQRHYLQEKDGVQQVILSQFSKWEMQILTLSQDNPEQQKKDKAYLARYRSQLIEDIDEAWKKCLEKSDPDKKYHQNQFVRRQKDGTLETASLDKVVKAFEDSMIMKWPDITRDLHERLPAELSPVDAARIKYMQGLNMGDILRERKHLAREVKRDDMAETRAQQQQLSLAKNASDAILHYAADDLDDAMREQLTAAKESEALNSIRNMFNKALQATRSELGQYDKETLKKLRKSRFDFFDDGAPIELKQGLLINAFRDMNERLTGTAHIHHFHAPIVAFLKQYPDNTALADIKEAYVRDAETRLADDIIRRLSWADENSGWFQKLLNYFIPEVVKEAAKNTLEAAKALKNADDTDRDSKAQELYVVLQSEAIHLNGVPRYYAGWKCEPAEQVVERSLRNFERGLAVVKGYDDIFRQDIQEEAVTRVYRKQCQQAIKAVEQNHVNVDGLRQWLHDVNEWLNNPEALHAFLSQLRNKDGQLDINSSLKSASRDLLRQVQVIRRRIGEQHAAVIEASPYYERKQTTLQQRLQVAFGKTDESEERVEAVSVNQRHTGFQSYIEVTIKAKLGEEARELACMQDFERFDEGESDESFQARFDQYQRDYREFEKAIPKWPPPESEEGFKLFKDWIERQSSEKKAVQKLRGMFSSYQTLASTISDLQNERNNLKEPKGWFVSNKKYREKIDQLSNEMAKKKLEFEEIGKLIPGAHERAVSVVLAVWRKEHKPVKEHSDTVAYVRKFNSVADLLEFEEKLPAAPEPPAIDDLEAEDDLEFDEENRSSDGLTP